MHHQHRSQHKLRFVAPIATAITTGPFALSACLALLLSACGETPSESPSGSTQTATPNLPEQKVSALVDPAPPAFATCRSCHSTQAGQHSIGPSLFGIMGTKAGTASGYNFSPALKSANLTWDRQQLDRWLQHPMKTVPGTKMVMPTSDPAKRAAIIDYLETLK